MLTLSYVIHVFTISDTLTLESPKCTALSLKPYTPTKSSSKFDTLTIYYEST